MPLHCAYFLHQPISMDLLIRLMKEPCISLELFNLYTRFGKPKHWPAHVAYYVMMGLNIPSLLTTQSHHLNRKLSHMPYKLEANTVSHT